MFSSVFRDAGLRLSLLLLALMAAGGANAITFEGRVIDETNQPLAGTNVYLEGLGIGTSSDLDGHFTLEAPNGSSYTLTISLVGYRTFTRIIQADETSVPFLTVTLEIDPVALEEIIFKAERETAVVSVDTPVRTEVIGQERLQESSNDGGLLSALSKQPGLNTRPCALCGSAGIGMQGLDPSYTEVKVDGLPLMSGLGALYGFDGISVSSLERVELVKGAGSDQGGAAAMAGSVNLITSGVSDHRQIQLDLTGGSTLKHALSTSINSPLFGAASGRLSLNYGAEPRLLDENGDHVTDAPQYQRGGGSISIGNPVGNGGTFRIGGRYFKERRFAGATDWTEKDRGSEDVYGREIFTDRTEASTALTYPLSDGDTFGFTAGIVRHNQDSWYGTTEYNAEQRLVVARAKIERNWSTLNQSEAAFEYRYDQYNDNLQLASRTDRLDQIPGLQLRHTWTPGPFWLVQGSLLSERYEEDGLVFTPRASLRFQPTFDWTFLFAGGSGYRPVTIFSLDKAVHAGFDQVIVPENLKPERNIGGSFTINHRRPGLDHSQSIDITLFYTQFRNKVVLGYSAHQDGTTLYTNADDAFSRGAEIRYDLAFDNGWSYTLSGTLSDVQYHDTAGWHLTQLQNRFTVNSMLMKSWAAQGITANVTGSVFGPQSLPAGRSRSDSPTYLILDLGLSKSWHSFTLSGTVNNALDYVQPDNPLIIDSVTGNQQYDSAMIYGPLLGRVFLISLSTTLGE